MRTALPCAIGRLFFQVAMTLCLLVSMASAAFAHASLNATSPVDGSVVAEAPARYQLSFSEPVSPLSLKLVRPDGSSSPLERFSLEGNVLSIEAPADQARGTHVLSWRVVSVDGHPIGGSVIFSIGEASASAPILEDAIDWPVRAGLWLSKIALYVGLFIGVGGVFARNVMLSGLEAGRRVAVVAILFGLAGAVLSAGLQGLDALAAPLPRLFDPIVWTTSFATTYGRTVWAALASFVLALAALWLPGVAGRLSAVLALCGTGLALALSGHASAAQPQWLMRPAVFVHAVAIAGWIGALAPLGQALRADNPAAPRALGRFSRVIPAFVAALIAAGMVLAFIQVETPSALLTTAYGQVFLVKLVLLVGLFLLVAVNRWTLTAPALAGEPSASRRLVRSIAVETALAIAIFGAAAAWRFTPPPRVIAAEAKLPAVVQLQSSKVTVVLWVGPAKAGPVDVVANVLNAEMEPIAPKEVAVSLSQPGAGIEPFRRILTRGEGMADWHGDDVSIPLPGLWHVRVDVLISDFEIDRLEGDITIRP